MAAMLLLEDQGHRGHGRSHKFPCPGGRIDAHGVQSPRFAVTRRRHAKGLKREAGEVFRAPRTRRATTIPALPPQR